VKHLEDEHGHQRDAHDYDLPIAVPACPGLCGIHATQRLCHFSMRLLVATHGSHIGLVYSPLNHRSTDPQWRRAPYRPVLSRGGSIWTESTVGVARSASAGPLSVKTVGHMRRTTILLHLSK
jgi:hypothetical protein